MKFLISEKEKMFLEFFLFLGKIFFFKKKKTFFKSVFDLLPERKKRIQIANEKEKEEKEKLENEKKQKLEKIKKSNKISKQQKNEKKFSHISNNLPILSIKTNELQELNKKEGKIIQQNQIQSKHIRETKITPKFLVQRRKVTLMKAFSVDGIICYVCYNKTGSQIAFSTGSYLFVMNSDDGKLIAEVELPKVDGVSDIHCRSLVFSPDGNSLYAGDSAGIINVVNTNISQNGIDDIRRRLIVREPELVRCGITHLSMERSNYLLLVQSKDSMLRVFETKVMVPSQRYSGIICKKFRMNSTFSPDGQYILAGSEDGSVNLWTVRKAEPVSVNEWSCKFDQPVTAVAWNRVENMVAFSSFGESQPILVFYDPDTPIQQPKDDFDI